MKYCCTAVLLYCCTAVLLYYCTDVLLYCCTALLLYCCGCCTDCKLYQERSTVFIYVCTLLGCRGTLSHRQSVSVKVSVGLQKSLCVYHIQSVSSIYSLCLSQNRQCETVTDSLCLSQTFCVCHRQSKSVTDSLCLSQAVCVRHRHSS